MIDYIGERLQKAVGIKVTQYEHDESLFVECYDEDDNRFMFLSLSADDTGYYTLINCVGEGSMTIPLKDKPVSVYVLSKKYFDNTTDKLLDILKQNGYLP